MVPRNEVVAVELIMRLSERVQPARRAPFTRQTIDGEPYRVEIWTYTDWEGLEEGERPGRAQHYPGVGWLLIRRDREAAARVGNTDPVLWAAEAG
jgi:hypothetical protein